MQKGHKPTNNYEATYEIHLALLEEQRMVNNKCELNERDLHSNFVRTLHTVFIY